MTTNMGVIDRTLRFVAAAVIAALYFTHQIAGTFAIVLGIFAVGFVVTGISGFCPLYVPLGISTRNANPANPAS